MDEFFNELQVLATHVPNLLDDHLLRIAILGLKEDIRNDLKLIDIKDVEQLWLKSTIETFPIIFFI